MILSLTLFERIDEQIKVEKIKVSIFYVTP